MKIVTLYESKLYQNDQKFKTEELKDEYYNDEFWIDSDYLLINGEEYSIVCINDEIILYNDEIELNDSQIKRIIAFYSDELLKEKKASKEFIELSTWPDDIEKSSKKMKSSSLAIKYRGGEGYYYGWWILN